MFVHNTAGISGSDNFDEKNVYSYSSDGLDSIRVDIMRIKNEQNAEQGHALIAQSSQLLSF